MELNALTRIKAARSVVATGVSKLRKFYESLPSDKERTFLLFELPQLLDKWFNGMSNSKKSSEHLPIVFGSTNVVADRYKAQDSLVVTLTHLRPLYPPKLKGPVFRSLLIPIKDLPGDPGPIELTTSKKFRPLQSWTYLPKPIVMDRSHKHDEVEMILGTKGSNAQKYVLATHETLEELAKDMLALCKELWKDAEIAEDAGGPDAHTTLAAGADEDWQDCINTMRDFSDEKEVMLHMPSGSSMPCFWRIATKVVHHSNPKELVGKIVDYSMEEAGAKYYVAEVKGNQATVVRLSYQTEDARFPSTKPNERDRIIRDRTRTVNVQFLDIAKSQKTKCSRAIERINTIYGIR